MVMWFAVASVDSLIIASHLRVEMASKNTGSASCADSCVTRYVVTLRLQARGCATL